MIGLLAGLAILQTPPELPPLPVRERVRSVLPNGMAFSAESVESGAWTSVALAVRLSGAVRLPEESGRVHLLEHLLALGPDRTLDRRLEALGMTLTAETSREDLVLEIGCRPERLPAALAALRDLAEPWESTSAQVAAEVALIREEAELRAEGWAARARAWTEIFGGSQPDPFGDLDRLAEVTPRDLASLHARLMVARRMAVSIVGPVEAETAADLIRRTFSPLPGGSANPSPAPEIAFRAARLPDPGPKELRAALSPGTATHDGLALIGQAALLAGRLPGGEASAPISLRAHLITVQASRWSESPSSLAEIHGAARAWVAGLGSLPDRRAIASARLLAQNPTLTLPRLEELAESLPVEALESARDAFGAGRAFRLGPNP
ncbi:MAG: insulinase family protein [Fimbriimonadaceae bacterium]|nr:insulinase family protein [Fimbriimonadaceae bacterium]